MFENELVMYGFNLHMASRLSSDLTADHMGRRIQGVGHAPRWILGHLVIGTDFASMMLGGERACTAAWHKAFGPGSSEDGADGPTPGLDELLAALRAGHERVESLARRTTPEAMNVPPPVAYFEGTPIKTKGHLVTQLITVHEAYHLGQLSAWRRQVGFKPLF